MKTKITVIGLTELELIHNDDGNSVWWGRRAIFVDDPKGKTIYYPRMESQSTTSLFGGNMSQIHTPTITSHELKIVMVYES